MGTQACIYARLNLFPEDSTRSREQIFGHDIATRSRRHRHIVWIFDDISELFYRATNRIIRVYTLSSVNSLVERSIVFQRWELINSFAWSTNYALKFRKFIKGGIFSRLENDFSLGHDRYSYSLGWKILVIETHIHDQCQARSEETAWGAGLMDVSFRY